MTVEQQNVVPENVNANEDSSFNHEEVTKSLTVRLKKEREHRQKAEEEREDLRDRLEKLEKKISNGKASSDENLEYQQRLSASGQTRDEDNKIEIAKKHGLLTEDQALQFAREAIFAENENVKTASFIEKVKRSKEKDPEFSEMIDNAHNVEGSITPQEAVLLKDLDNGVSVFKHLLKDKEDMDIFRTALQNSQLDSGLSFKKFVYELSKKLDSSEKPPRPSKYNVVPKINDVGRGNSFDSSEYIKNKY